MIGFGLTPGAIGSMAKAGIDGTNNAQLIAGVQGGTLNRNEFRDLNADLNQVQRLEDSFAKDGKIDQDEQNTLNLCKLAYQNKLKRYGSEDMFPAPREAGGIDRELNRQSGDIFDGLRAGQIDSQEGMQLLSGQRNASSNLDWRSASEQDRIMEQNRFEIDRAKMSGQQPWNSGPVEFLPQSPWQDQPLSGPPPHQPLNLPPASVAKFDPDAILDPGPGLPGASD